MENTPKQQEEGKQIIRVLACVMNKLIEANQNTQTVVSRDITKFHALEPPNISVLDYLERIHKYACCSNECFILSLIYIDRLIQMNNFALTSLNVHRVIITSVMLAAKFFDDQYFNNAYYAKVGGVPVNEMNSLEVELLFRLNFSLHVTTDSFQKYKMELSHHASINFCKCVTGRANAEVALPRSQAALQGQADSHTQQYQPEYEKRPQVPMQPHFVPEPVSSTAQHQGVQHATNSYPTIVPTHPVSGYSMAQIVNPVDVTQYGYVQPTLTPQQQLMYQQPMVHPQLDPQDKVSHLAGKSFHHSAWNKVHSKHHMAYFQEGTAHPLFDEAVR